MSPSTEAAVEDLLSIVGDAPNPPVDVNAVLGRYGDIEPWKFLCGVADRRRIAFHGTGDAGIESFEPRRPSILLRSASRTRSLPRPTRSGRCSTPSWTEI